MVSQIMVYNILSQTNPLAAFQNSWTSDVLHSLLWHKTEVRLAKLLSQILSGGLQSMQPFKLVTLYDKDFQLLKFSYPYLDSYRWYSGLPFQSQKVAMKALSFMAHLPLSYSLASSSKRAVMHSQSLNKLTAQSHRLSIRYVTWLCS